MHALAGEQQQPDDDPVKPAARVFNAPKRSTARAETPIDMTAIETVSGMNASPVSMAL